MPGVINVGGLRFTGQGGVIHVGALRIERNAPAGVIHVGGLRFTVAATAPTLTGVRVEPWTLVTLDGALPGVVAGGWVLVSYTGPEPEIVTGEGLVVTYRPQPSPDPQTIVWELHSSDGTATTTSRRTDRVYPFHGDWELGSAGLFAVPEWELVAT